MFAQQSTQENKPSQICFSEQEFAEFEVETLQKIETTAEEAVSIAVIPLKLNIIGLEIEKEYWYQETIHEHGIVLNLSKEITKKDITIEKTRRRMWNAIMLIPVGIGIGLLIGVIWG